MVPETHTIKDSQKIIIVINVLNVYEKRLNIRWPYRPH